MNISMNVCPWGSGETLPNFIIFRFNDVVGIVEYLDAYNAIAYCEYLDLPFFLFNLRSMMLLMRETAANFL